MSEFRSHRCHQCRFVINTFLLCQFLGRKSRRLNYHKFIVHGFHNYVNLLSKQYKLQFLGEQDFSYPIHIYLCSAWNSRLVWQNTARATQHITLPHWIVNISTNQPFIVDYYNLLYSNTKYCCIDLPSKNNNTLRNVSL